MCYRSIRRVVVESLSLMKRNLVTLIMCGLLGGTNFTLLLPLGGLLLAERGVPAWQIGLVGAVPWGFVVLALPFVPALVQRYNPLHAFHAVGWLGVLGSLLFLVSDNIWLWGVAYALIGIKVAGRWVITDTLITTLPPPEQRARWMGLHMFIISFMLVIGPLVVAFLGADHSTFWVALALLLISTVLGHSVRIPAANLQHAHSEARGFSLLWQHASLMAGQLVAALAVGCVEGSVGKMLPVQAYELGYSEQISALAAGVSGAGNIFSQLLIAWLLARSSKLCLVRGLLVLMLLASGLSAVLAHLLPGYLAAIFVMGGCAGAIYTLVILVATDRCSPADGVHRISALALCYTCGGMIGPLLAGFAMNMDMRWGFAGVMSLFALAALWAIHRLPIIKGDCA